MMKEFEEDEHTNGGESIPLYQGSIQSNPINNIAPLPSPVSDCPICLSSISLNDSRQTTCGHSFHKNCIERWMLYNTTCPVCRYVLVDRVPPIDLPEYPQIGNGDQLVDYLPYRFICGRLRCCYYQIPPSFMLSIQLLGLFFIGLILINSIMSWDGTVFDYVTVITSSLVFLIVLFLHILLRNNWRFHNCRVVPIDGEFMV